MARVQSTPSSRRGSALGSLVFCAFAIAALASCSSEAEPAQITLISVETDVVRRSGPDIVRGGEVIGQFISIVLRYQVVIRNDGDSTLGSPVAANRRLWLEIDPGESLRDAVPLGSIFNAQRIPQFGCPPPGLDNYGGETSIPPGALSHYFIGFGPLWTIDTSESEDGTAPEPTEEQMARIEAAASDADGILWEGNNRVTTFPLAR